MKSLRDLISVLLVASRRIESKLDIISKRTEFIVNQNDTVKDLISKMDGYTTAIGQRIDAINAKLADALAKSQPLEQSTLDELDALAQHLKALGADPTNPFPTPPPAAATDPAP